MKKIIIGLLFVMTVVSFGKETHLQIGLGPETNIIKGETVKGLRIPIFFGKTEKVVGVDFNLFASEVDEAIGFQGGIFLGAGIFTKVNKKFRGFGLGLANVYGGTSKGLLIGSGNLTTDFVGLKMGIVNYSKVRSTCDIGAFNVAGKATFQLGLINSAKELNGIQIGVLNFADNGILPVMPFINFSWHL